MNHFTCVYRGELNKKASTFQEDSESMMFLKPDFSIELRIKTSKELLNKRLVWVLITNLNTIEINECWEEMATQIKTFKRKYRKLEVKLQQKDISYQVDPLSAYESTQKVIAKS